MPTNLMSSAEVAATLGCNVRTVTRMVPDGVLEPVQKMPGKTGAYLFDREAVEALAAERAS